MSGEVSDLISLVAMVTSFIAYLEAKKANNTNDAIGALTAVIEAAEKTDSYLHKRASGEDRNRNTEHTLAELWASAAFSISRIDKDLSVRLSAKSKFWRDPDTWDTSLRAHKDISLLSVRDDAQQLLESYT